MLAYGHLALLHGLEQGTLHLGGGAVNLVGEDEVAEDGTFLHLEAFVLLAVDEGAYEVGRQQVGGELYAAELGIDGFCQGGDGQRLRQSGHPLQQHVATAQQTNQQAVDHMLLAHNMLAHFHTEHIDKSAFASDALVQLLNVYRFHCLLIYLLFPCLLFKKDA